MSCSSVEAGDMVLPPSMLLQMDIFVYKVMDLVDALGPFEY